MDIRKWDIPKNIDDALDLYGNLFLCKDNVTV